jgi:hypothetical protein
LYIQHAASPFSLCMQQVVLPEFNFFGPTPATVAQMHNFELKQIPFIF